MTMTRVWCITMTCTGPRPRHKARADKGDNTMIIVLSSIMRGHHRATPLMIPSSTTFWKVLIVLVNEGVNHHNLIQANNSKKCHSNNNSRSRFPNNRHPLPRLSPVPPQFTRPRHRISSPSDNNNHHDNSNNHNNKGLSRNLSWRLHKNRQVAGSKQVLGNPHQKDRDNPSGSESLP